MRVIRLVAAGLAAVLGLSATIYGGVGHAQTTPPAAPSAVTAGCTGQPPGVPATIKSQDCRVSNTVGFSVGVSTDTTSPTANPFLGLIIDSGDSHAMGVIDPYGKQPIHGVLNDPSEPPMIALADLVADPNQTVTCTDLLSGYLDVSLHECTSSPSGDLPTYTVRILDMGYYISATAVVPGAGTITLLLQTINGQPLLQVFGELVPELASFVPPAPPAATGPPPPATSTDIPLGPPPAPSS